MSCRYILEIIFVIVHNYYSHLYSSAFLYVVYLFCIVSCTEVINVRLFFLDIVFRILHGLN